MFKRRKETQATREVTGGADSHNVTNLSIGMRKGSAIVRAFASKSFCAVLVEGGLEGHRSQKTVD